MPDIIVTDPKTGRKIRLSYTGQPPSDDEIADAFEASQPAAKPAASAPAARPVTSTGKPSPWAGIKPLSSDQMIQPGETAPPPPQGSEAVAARMGLPSGEEQMRQIRAQDPNAPGRRPYLPSPTEQAVTGALLTAGRQILPSAAAVQAGALAAGATSEMSPFVAIPAGLITMFATNYLANKAQDAAVKPLMGENLFNAGEAEQERFRTEHPIGALVAENAPGLLFGKPVSPVKMFTKAGAAPAALGAGLGLGTEGYAQIQSGQFDPWRLAGSTAIGATLSGEPTARGERFIAPAERAGAGLRTAFTRPGPVDNAPVDNAAVIPGATAPTVGTVRYTGDGKAVRVVGTTDDGRLRVRVEGETATRRVDPDAFLKGTQDLSGPYTRIGIGGRDDLAKALQEAMGLPADQAGQVADRYHAVAVEESRRTGTPVEQWYKDHLAGITAGGEAIARDLMAQAGRSKAQIEQAAKSGALPQGAVTFADGGGKGDSWRAVVSALVNPDATTGYHELGHIVRRMLTPAENEAVGVWAGAQKLPDGSWQYPVAAEEKFADAVEAVETDRAQRDAAYAGVAPAFRKVANAYRWIADRVTDAVPGLSRVKDLEGSPLNPDIVKLIRARFGEGRPSGRAANVPDVPQAQGSRGAAAAPEAAGPIGGGVRAPGGAGGENPAGVAGPAAEGGAGGGEQPGGGSRVPEGNAPAQALTPAAPRIEQMNPDELGILPGMQFKREISDAKNNVTDQLKGQREYDAYDGGVLTVFEDANGKRFAVDGHHRRELAQRAERFVMPGPDGKPIEAPRQIAVQVLAAKDGWTPETAKAYGVRRNLLEGKGRAVDAADALTTLAGRDAARAEVAKLPKSALTRDTAGLIELDPTGRELVLNRKVDASVAAGVGKALPGDPARQKIALDLAAGRSDLATYDDGVTLGREVLAEDVVSGGNAVQLGLEGMDTPSVRSTAAERALLKKDVITRAVAEQRNAKAGLGLDLLPGETINEEARKAIATEIGENRGQVSEKVGAALTFDAQVQETLRSAARELAEGKISRQDAARRVYDVTVESAKRPIAEIVGGKPAPAAVPPKSGGEAVSVSRLHASDGPERPLRVGDTVAVIRNVPDGRNRIGQTVEVKARLTAEHTLPDGARGFEYEYPEVRGGFGPRQTRTGMLREDAGKWRLVERAPEIHNPSAEAADEGQTPLFKEDRRPKNREVIEQLDRVPFVPAETVAHALGDKPEYLNDILRFMNDKRQKVVEGTLNGRDVAKAYFTTLASQGAGAMRAERLQAKLHEQGIDLPLPEQFLGRSKTGAVTVRPEDAAAAWLATPKGQRALDAIEHGRFDPEAWAEGFAIRRAFGDDRFAGLNAAGQPRPGAVNFRNLSEVTAAINAAKGDPAKIGEALSTLNGIGPGKLGFVKHLVGFGDSPTIDARQVNVWLTGKGRIAGDRSEGAQAARLFKRSGSDQRVSRYMAERVNASLEALKGALPALADVPTEAAGHILHQWVWDRAAQASDTPLHHHAGLYEALTLFQHKEPKVGDSLKGKDGNTYRIDAIDAAKGTARVTILDKDGKQLGRIPAAPLGKWTQEKRAFDEAQRSAKIRGAVSDVLNTPRTLQASVDLSAPLRQGAILSAAEPKLAGRAFIQMFRALKTKTHEQIVADLAARPNASLYETAKLYLSTREGGPLAGKEEAFLSKLAAKLPLVKHSEQAYTAFLDVLRADVFDKYAAELRAEGLTPENNAKDFADVAHFINAATGRGELPQFLKGSGDLLNGLFFSPRYATSRLEVMNPATYAKMTPAARKIALRAAVKFAGLTAMTLTLLHAAGADVSLDPDSPDFLKARYGDWRLDLGAGSVQYLRVMFRLVGGFYRNFSGEGNERGKNPSDVALTFGRGKLAPVPSYVVDAATGKDFTGQPFSPVGGALERVTPMFWHDLWQAWQAEGIEGGMKILPSAFGLGVSRYENKPAKGGSGMGILTPAMPSMPEMPKMPGS